MASNGLICKTELRNENRINFRTKVYGEKEKNKQSIPLPLHIIHIDNPRNNFSSIRMKRGKNKMDFLQYRSIKSELSHHRHSSLSQKDPRTHFLKKQEPEDQDDIFSDHNFKDNLRTIQPNKVCKQPEQDERRKRKIVQRQIPVPVLQESHQSRKQYLSKTPPKQREPKRYKNFDISENFIEQKEKKEDGNKSEKVHRQIERKKILPLIKYNQKKANTFSVKKMHLSDLFHPEQKDRLQGWDLNQSNHFQDNNIVEYANVSLDPKPSPKKKIYRNKK